MLLITYRGSAAAEVEVAVWKNTCGGYQIQIHSVDHPPLIATAALEVGTNEWAYTI